jgi:hypothetical protein
VFSWAWHSTPERASLVSITLTPDGETGTLLTCSTNSFFDEKARDGHERGWAGPESWMSFLAVDDVDARVAKAIAAGAKLMLPVFDVPNVGRIAMLMEPSGAGIGWITPVA